MLISLGEHTDWMSSEALQRRSELFTLEQRRQRDRVGRVEKIEIRYQGLPGDTTLLMNKGLSTPYNCAQREQTRRSTVGRPVTNASAQF